MIELRRRALVGLVALVATAGGCAGGWTQMKSKRITGYAETPRHFSYTVGQLEYSYAAMSSFFPKADVGNVEVLFLSETDLMLTFGAERAGMVLPAVPGSPRVGRNNLIVMGPATDHQTSTRLLSNLFIHKVVPNAPLWMHESLSGYFSTAVVQAGKGQWRACFGVPMPLGVRFFQMPLDRFFSISWQAFPTSDPGFYRGTGRLLMDYIFHADGGAHLEKLPAILASAAQGTPGPQIMASSFPGVSLEQLGQRISDYKGSQKEQRERGFNCPLPMPIEASQVPDETSPQESPVSPEEMKQLLDALKKLPHGERFPMWYPPEVVGVTSAAGMPPAGA